MAALSCAHQHLDFQLCSVIMIRSMSFFIDIAFPILILLNYGVNGQLTANFYDSACPNLLSIVQPVVQQAIQKEARMAASLLRLHFHDCFVNGCDGSILLDDTSTFTGEKTAAPNLNSVRGFDVIDDIKTQVENSCSGVVSCADIVAIAAHDGVYLSGGPSWAVLLGRRDSTTASLNDANTNIPPPTFDVNALISSFQAQGLSQGDMVALSGGHTIGQARCTTFRARIYNETTIDQGFQQQKQMNCPSVGGDNNLSPLDVLSPTQFNNDYYKNLQAEKGLLHSDQVLFSNSSSTVYNLVQSYIGNENTFFDDFKTAMVNMGNIKPLTGNSGEIRKNCRKVNS